MNVIFADGIVDCIGPFVGIVIFLLISFGSWIMQQVAEANKRAAQQRRANLPPRQTPQPATGEMQDFLRRAAEQASPQGRPPVAQEAEIYTAEVIEPRVLRPSVTSQVSTDDLARHARELGEDLDQADERLDSRLHKQFDHAVGALGDSSDSIHEDPSKKQLPPTAVTTGEIIDIFRHPERVREAIIMAEILNRRS